MIKSLMETNEKFDHATLDKMAENVTAPEDVIWMIRQHEKITKLQKKRPSTLRLGRDTCLKSQGNWFFFFFFDMIDLRKHILKLFYIIW